MLADSRYTIQARREAPEARLFEAYNDLPARWPELAASVGARRVAVEAGFVSHARVAAARGGRAGRRARARRGLARGGPGRQGARRARARGRRLRGGRPGARGAAARDPARRDRGRPGAAARVADADRRAPRRSRSTSPAWPARRRRCRTARRATDPCVAGQVLLFDFGAQVAGYRSDMTRTLFVGDPTARDLDVYELVARAQVGGDRGDRGGGRPAAVASLRRCRAAGRSTAVARDVIASARARRPFRPQPRSRDRARDARGAVARQDAPATTRCRARRCSRSSPASTSMARWASGSRTSCARRSRRQGRAPDPISPRDSRRRGRQRLRVDRYAEPPWTRCPSIRSPSSAG